MVIMASGIARGRLRTNAELPKITAICIFQLIGWKRHAALVSNVLLWYWTLMLWSIDTCKNKVSADEGRAVRKPVNANPGLKVNRSTKFNCRHMFITAFLLCTWGLFKLKTEGQIIYKTSPQSYKTQDENSRLSWISLIGLWATWPRDSAFRFG